MSDTDILPYAITLETRDLCFCLHIQRAARALARRYDAALRPVGITSGQFSLLMSLNRPEPPPMRAVADVLAMDRTTLTAYLKPLERRGLVRHELDAKDRRSRRLVLTAQGKALLAAAVPIWRDTQAETAKLMEKSGPEGLLADLRALS
jgi:DNA-binding MarR family transcriptional regulator